MNIVPSSDIPQKRCNKCPGPDENRLHPATTEYFHRDKTKPDGLRSICKICSGCHEYSNPGHQRSKIHSEEERLVSQREAVRRYRQTEKGKKANREYQRLRRSTPEGKAEHKFYNKRAYIAHHKERRAHAKQYYEQNKESITERSRQYRQDNPEKMTLVDRAHKHKRKSLKLANGGSHTTVQLQEQRLRQKSKCYYCRKKLGNDWHVEHIVPLSRGGTNDIDNIVIACPPCNMKKHDKLLHEWSEGGRLL